MSFLMLFTGIWKLCYVASEQITSQQDQVQAAFTDTCMSAGICVSVSK